MGEHELSPTGPAHPWKKTVRTVIAGVGTAALLLPVVVEQAGLDLDSATWGWLASALVVLAAITRVLALPVVQSTLARVGLAHDDVEGSRVVVLKVPAPDLAVVAGRPVERVVAGPGSPLPTGSPLPAGTTVAQLTGPGPEKIVDREPGY